MFFLSILLLSLLLCLHFYFFQKLSNVLYFLILKNVLYSLIFLKIFIFYF